jgi:hypothetical protein
MHTSEETEADGVMTGIRPLETKTRNHVPVVAGNKCSCLGVHQPTIPSGKGVERGEHVGDHRGNGKRVDHRCRP